MSNHKDEGTMSDINTTQSKQVDPIDNQANAKFSRNIIQNSAIASNDITAEKFDMDKAEQKSSDAFVALEASGGLQSMLVAQMLSIHELQQRTMTYAHSSDSLELKKYYTNAGVKLTNCFVQQANMLTKLQGVGGQKITVEHVDVHQGGQAVVGNIQGVLG